MQREIQATTAPHMKDYARSNLLFELRAIAAALHPPPAAPVEKERDPEKAAAWFAAQGYKVVTSG